MIPSDSEPRPPIGVVHREDPDVIGLIEVNRAWDHVPRLTEVQ